MLKPEVSIPAGLATAALVVGIQGRGLPPAADLRQTEPGDPDVAAIRKQNAWLAAGAVGAVSLIARDPTIFIVGGAMVVALDWANRHAEWVNPATGKVASVLGFEDKNVVAPPAENLMATDAMDYPLAMAG